VRLYEQPAAGSSLKKNAFLVSRRRGLNVRRYGSEAISVNTTYPCSYESLASYRDMGTDKTERFAMLPPIKTSSCGRGASRGGTRRVSAHTPQRKTACLEVGLVETVPPQLDSSGKHFAGGATDNAPFVCYECLAVQLLSVCSQMRQLQARRLQREDCNSRG
jgi:hypothetical protein